LLVTLLMNDSRAASSRGASATAPVNVVEVLREPESVVPAGSCRAGWTLTHFVGMGGAVAWLVVPAVAGRAITEGTIKKLTAAGAIRRAILANFIGQNPLSGSETLRWSRSGHH
jgi:hypothetical protein